MILFVCSEENQHVDLLRFQRGVEKSLPVAIKTLAMHVSKMHTYLWETLESRKDMPCLCQHQPSGSVRESIE